MADAAEAAEDEPRASMIAAPRLATVGMKSFSSQAWSPTSSAAFWPPTSAWKRSGYWVAEWLPQIVIFLMSVTGAPVLAASWLIARLWSRRVSAEKRSRGMSGALVIAMSALVLAGLPVTPMRTSSAATVVEGLALRGEDRAVGREQVAALHAGAARTRADEEGEVDAVEDLLGVRADLDAGEVRERAVVELHDDALERLEGGLDLEQSQLDRAVRGQRAAGEAEEQAVADLAGGAGDGDLEGFGGHGGTPREVCGRRDVCPADASSAGSAAGLWSTAGMLAPMTRGLRAVRRPPDARLRWQPGSSSGSPACAGIGQPAPYDSPGINGLVIPTPTPAPADFVEGVDNPWLALAPGTRWTYDVTEDAGTRGRIDVEVQDGTVPVAGLEATAVQTTTDLGGGTTSVATRLYAQDEAGNVWLVGSDTDDASWRAGEDGAEAGLAMPADPRLGDGWLSYDVPGLPRASATIEDQSSELVQLRNEADTTTRTVYEKGVGLVGLEDLDAGWTAELVEG